MKKFILLLVLLCTNLMAQVPNDLVAIQDKSFNEYYTNSTAPSIVKGTILNFTEEKLNQLQIKYTIVSPLRESSIEKSAIIDNNGSFSLNIDHPFPYQQIYFSIGKLFYFDIYVNSGLEITIDLQKAKDSDQFFFPSGISFQGPDSDLNDFMYNQYWSNQPNRNLISRKLANLDNNQDISLNHYQKTLDSLYKSLSKLDSLYITNHPSSYSWILKNERISAYYGKLLNKHWGSKMNDSLWKKINRHKPFLTSRSGRNFYNYLFFYLQQLPNKTNALDIEKITNTVEVNETEKENLNEFLELLNLLNSRKPLDTLKFQQLNKVLNPILTSYFAKKKLNEDIQLINNVLDEENTLIALTSGQKDNLLKLSNLLSLQKKEVPINTMDLQEIKKISEPILSSYLSYKEIQKDIKFMDSTFAVPKADFMKLKIVSENLKTQSILNNLVLKSLKTPWCKDYINKEISLIESKLEKINSTLVNSKINTTTTTIFGTTVMEFDFGAKLYVIKDLNSKELLSKIKTEFNGKAILLDFWAVWCAPCLRDFPVSKKLHTRTKDEPIEFVYLCSSVGADLDKWKSKIAEYKLSGTHLFVDQSIESELMKIFDKKAAFPTYALINKNDRTARSLSNLRDINESEFIEMISEE